MSEPRCRTLVLHGKLAAVWQLHEDGTIEHYHFTAQPDDDTNQVVGGRLMSRPGDEDHERLLAGFQEDA